MASSPSAPAETNTVAAAQQSGLSQLNFAQLATQANRINTTNQSGSVKYTSKDTFDQTGYNQALEHWKSTGSDPKTIPSKNEFSGKSWEQSETLNPTLQDTLTRQQNSNANLAMAQQIASSKAVNALGTSYKAPQAADYLASVPGIDKTALSKISAPTNLQSNLSKGLDGISTSDNARAGAFTSNGTKLDTNFSDNLGGVGTVANANTKLNGFSSTAKVDGNVNDNLGGVGKITDANTKLNGFSSTAKVDTNLNDNLAGVGKLTDANTKLNSFSNTSKVDTNVNDNLSGVGGVKTYDKTNGAFTSNAKVDTNVADNLANTGAVKNFDGKAGTFTSTAKTNTDVNGAVAGAKALNQDGAGQVGQFTNTAGGVKTSVANANIDGSLTNNLAANKVNLAQQSFNQGGAKVNTSAPTFDESTSDKYAKAVYESQMSFMRDDLEKARTQEANRLALQGLGVDSEASVGASKALHAAQAQQLNQLANQSILTGADIARNNYASQLQGFESGNNAEAQRYAQELQRFNTNQAANAQAFGQNKSLFDTNNAAQNQIFENNLANATLNNAAQNQKFTQQNQSFQNNLSGTQLNQQIINDTNSARNQAFTQGLQKFSAGNDAAQQQFAQDATKYQQNLAGLNANAAFTDQNNQAQNQRFAQALQAYQAGNTANTQQFALDDSRFQNGIDANAANAALVAQQNQAQAQKYSQTTNNFNLNNQASAQQFDQTNAAYQNYLKQQAQQAATVAQNNSTQQARFGQATDAFKIQNDANAQQFDQQNQAFQNYLKTQAQQAATVAQNNQAQQARYGQATNNFQLNNAANAQIFDQTNVAYQNYLKNQAQTAAAIGQNNDAQNQRYQQAANTFNQNNTAKTTQFAQDTARYQQGLDAIGLNAQMKSLDNANAMTAQQFNANNLNFANQANQQNYQNQIAALQANMGLRDANNNINNQAFNQALTKYSVDTAAAQDNRYRALNEYNALANGGSPVSANNQYQNFAQQQTTQGVDYAGAAQQTAAQRQAQYQAGVASANATNQGIASLAGTAAMMFMMSDKKLKTNIEETGQTPSGRTTYQWDWNKTAEKKYGLTGSSEGVIAQENKDITVRDPMTGYLAVDYARVNTKKRK